MKKKEAKQVIANAIKRLTKSEKRKVAEALDAGAKVACGATACDYRIPGGA